MESPVVGTPRWTHGVSALRPRLRAIVPILATLLAACAPPAPSAPERPVRAVVISDLNGAYGSHEYAAEVGRAVHATVTRWRPDLVLVAGDMVAGQSPRLADSTVRRMWSVFDAVVATPLRAANIPLVVTLGNHDGSAYPAHARDRRIAMEHWRGSVPTGPGVRVLDAEHFPLRYTLFRGDVFVAVWDATRGESGTDAALLEWLRAALSTPEARGARHRVVLGHLPLYAVAEGRNRAGEVLADGEALRLQLERWGATMYVSGHHHAYFPGRRGGMELLHSGALGGGPRPLIGRDTASSKTATVLDFLGDSVAITTYVVPANGEPGQRVALEALPRLVCGVTGFVVRRDLDESVEVSMDHQGKEPACVASGCSSSSSASSSSCSRR